MIEIYAKIDMTNPGSGVGTVVNTQVINPGDPLDPNFTWVNMTAMSPAPAIAWTYDGTNFYPPSGD